MGFYLDEHDDTLAQNLTDGSFVVIVALKDFFLQKFPCGEMKGLVGPVEPAAVQPLLTCQQSSKRAFEPAQVPSSHAGCSLTEAETRLTSVVLPQTFNVDDVRLQVRLCGLHVHVVPHVVHAVLKAAVLTVGALWVGLPRPPGRVLSLLSFWTRMTVWSQRLGGAAEATQDRPNADLDKYPVFPLPV